MTPMQLSIALDLKQQYGEPDLILQSSDCPWVAAGVLVMLVWHDQKRRLTILPNGDRLSWSPVTV